VDRWVLRSATPPRMPRAAAPSASSQVAADAAWPRPAARLGASLRRTPPPAYDSAANTRAQGPCMTDPPPGIARLETWQPDGIGPSLLEEFYAWLVRQHGRDRRATIATYSAGVRAFVRFLARRALLAPDVTYEQMRENAREVIGRASYKTPRIDRRL